MDFFEGVAISPIWSNVMNLCLFEIIMRKRVQKYMLKETPLVRASISFPPVVNGELRDIAAQKKVSRTSIIRDWAEQHVSGKTTSIRKSPV
jgi:hypothetical protein